MQVTGSCTSTLCDYIVIDIDFDINWEGNTGADEGKQLKPNMVKTMWPEQIDYSSNVYQIM